MIENFNRTLQTMLVKHAKELGPAWDLHPADRFVDGMRLRSFFAYQGESKRPSSVLRED